MLRRAERRTVDQAMGDRRARVCLGSGLLALLRHVSRRWALHVSARGCRAFLVEALRHKYRRQMRAAMERLDGWAASLGATRRRADDHSRRRGLAIGLAALRVAVDRGGRARSVRLYGEFLHSAVRVRRAVGALAQHALEARAAVRARLRATLLWKFSRYVVALRSVAMYARDAQERRRRLVQAKAEHSLLSAKTLVAALMTCAGDSLHELPRHPLAGAPEPLLRRSFAAWRAACTSSVTRVCRIGGGSDDEVVPTRGAKIRIDPRAKPRTRIHLLDSSVEFSSSSELSNYEKRQILGRGIVAVLEELRGMRSSLTD